MSEEIVEVIEKLEEIASVEQDPDTKACLDSAIEMLFEAVHASER